MSGPDQRITRHQRLCAQVSDLLGAGVYIGIVAIEAAREDLLLPAEAAQIRGAIRTRRHEFAAGRQAARIALEGTGLGVVPVLSAPSRAPLWPAGIAGSIAHAEGWALAAISREKRLIGLDLENDEDLPPEILATVLSPRERAWVATMPRPGQWAKAIFCVKECAYKAQFPLSQSLFGFEMFETCLDPGSGVFVAVFQDAAAPFQRGEALQGRFRITEGLVLTALAA